MRRRIIASILLVSCACASAQWSLKSSGVISIQEHLIKAASGEAPPASGTTNLVLGMAGEWYTDQLTRYPNAVIIAPGVPPTNGTGRCWLDYSTNQFNGVSASAPDYITNNNVIGWSFAATSSEYIDWTNGLSRIRSLTNFTIFAWTKIALYNGASTIFGLTVGAPSYNSYRFVRTRTDQSPTANLQVYCYNGTTPLNATSVVAVLTNDAWSSVAFTVGAATNAIYVNGTQVALNYANGSATTRCGFDAITNAAYARFGFNSIPPPYTFPFNGVAGQFRLYDRHLSASEILDIHTNTLAQGGYY